MIVGVMVELVVVGDGEGEGVVKLEREVVEI